METERQKPSIEPEDATPDEGVERPDPPEPDPDHAVEDKERED